MKPAAIICDLDGTLANIDHRRHFVEGSEKKNWKAFFEGIPHDGINPAVRAFLSRYRREGLRIILMTGRPENTLPDTLEWLTAQGVVYHAIFHRKAADFRADEVVKKELYKEFVEPHHDVELVLDDRDKVVKMWRELGLQCWQVAEGNF